MISVRKTTFATLLTILSASVGLLPIAASAQNSDPVFTAVSGQQVCPAGSTLVTYDEAVKFRASLGKILGTWDIARLADRGSMDGPGYDLKIRRKDDRTLGGSLCKKLNLAPLVQYYSPVGTDNYTTGTAAGLGSIEGRPDKKYVSVRTEACVFSEKEAGTVPLNLYYGTAADDNFTTATAEGAKSATDNGYTFVRVEGYVYPSPQTGTVPLTSYYSSKRTDNFTTATAEGAKSATDAGYTLNRVEGHAFPASACK